MESNPTPKWFIAIPVICLVAFSAAVFAASSNWRRGFLFMISGLFGFLLKYGPFGFTCTFRTMLNAGDFTQMRHMCLMLFFSTLFISLLQIKHWIKHPFFFPSKDTFSLAHEKIGWSLVLVSYMFGMGMQLGSGCATGTLVGIGEGSLKSCLVFVFFIMGATIGALNPVFNWWSKLPAFKSPTTIHWLWVLLILLVLTILTIVADRIVQIIKERKNASGNDQKSFESNLKQTRLLMTIGVSDENDQKTVSKKFLHDLLIDALIGLCIAAFFVCDGQVIGVMGVFPLIGGTILKACGCKVSTWDYYKTHPLPTNFLDTDMFVSDAFIALGAFLASSILRNFGHGQKKEWMEYVKGVVGGLLMGLGGRMSYGCNIGSMLSGITSASMHGFVWMVCAICGSGTVFLVTYLINKLKETTQKGQVYDEI